MVGERYIRQVQFQPFGQAGQDRLARSRVLICGCGGLGSTLANYLVRAGVGFIRLVDRDLVDLSNLHRQCLFDEHDALHQVPKAVAAAEKLRPINSQVEIEPVVADVRPENLPQLARDVHLILDGTDNFETRFLINDFAVKSGIPWIFGSCLAAEGQVMVILPGETPCLRCVVPAPPASGTMPTCETAGILGPVVGVVASLQAMEALKILTDCRQQATRDLIAINLWPLRIRQLSIHHLKDDQCPTCGQGHFEFLEARQGSTAVALCGRKTVQITPASGSCDLEEVAARWAALGTVEQTPYFIRLKGPDWSLTLFPDGRALITGTEDLAFARTLYARFVGT